MKDQSILLRGDKLQAYIVPSSDAHGSEYLNDKDKRRSFITGFTGYIQIILPIDIFKHKKYFLNKIFLGNEIFRFKNINSNSLYFN